MNVIVQQLFKASLLFLACLLMIACVGATAADAQTINVSISTRTTTGFAQPNVKVTIGPRAVTTDKVGVGSIDLPAGEYKVKAVTKCRVAEFSMIPNINIEEVGGTRTEPVIRLRAPQEWPVGIQFVLDCTNVKKPRGRS